MKLVEYYSTKDLKSKDELRYFKDHLKTTNKNENYLNDWNKVKERTSQKISEELKKKINDIINKSKNIEEDIMKAIENKIIPMSLVRQMLILSSNEKKLSVNIGGKDLTISFKDKKDSEKFTKDELDTILNVLKSQNFFYPLSLSKPNFDIETYILYTSIGMDTNGRKNRSGTNYENKIKTAIEEWCKKYSLKYTFHFTGSFKEENPKKYTEIFTKIKGVKKIPDFIIFGKEKSYLIEANYSDGGSKLQETIKAYVDLQNKIKTEKSLEFIYITDGKQWCGETSHLKDAWEKIDYIINYEMLLDNVLDVIIKDK